MTNPLRVDVPEEWELGIAQRIMNKIIYGKDWEFWQKVDRAYDETKDQEAVKED